MWGGELDYYDSSLALGTVEFRSSELSKNVNCGFTIAVMGQALGL